MKTLEDQLRDYGRFTDLHYGPAFSTALDEEVMQYATPTTRVTRRRGGAWVLVAAALLVLVTFGILPFLIDNTAGVVDDPSPTVDFGSLSWTEKSGSYGSLPAGGIAVASSGDG